MKRRSKPGTGERERAAWITLADLALRATDGDRDRAKEMLRPALQAIGAVPYEQARQHKYRYGAAG